MFRIGFGIGFAPLGSGLVWSGLAWVWSGSIAGQPQQLISTPGSTRTCVFMGNGLEIIANVPLSQPKRKCINIAFNREREGERQGERL